MSGNQGFTTAGGIASYFGGSSDPGSGPATQQWQSGYDVSSQPGQNTWQSGYDVPSQPGEQPGLTPYPGFPTISNATGVGTPGLLQQLLGLGGGAGGLIGGLGGMAGLAGILAPLLGGLYSANKTGQATSQVIGGINNASNIAKQLLGNTSAYAPYTGAGQQAISKLNGMNFTPMNFAPISQLPMLGPLGNRQLTLGNVAAAPTTVTRGK